MKGSYVVFEENDEWMYRYNLRFVGLNMIFYSQRSFLVVMYPFKKENAN